MSPATFLTTQDVAKRFGVSASLVRRWARLGILPAARFPGRKSHLRFLPDAVDAFEAEYLTPREASA
jgi:excisionase family DNA binding protein